MRGPTRRPTRDIDFLGRSITNDAETIGAVIGEVAVVPVDDGVLFVTEHSARFVDPVISGNAGTGTWRPDTRTWAP